MEGAAVDKIAELATRNQIIEIDGQTFARGDYKPVKYIARPDALVGRTLTGFVDYLRANVEDIDFLSCMIRVVDHGTVELVQRYDLADQDRTVFYRAKLDDGLPVFQFDRFMPTEEFIIKARALFQPSDDMDRIVAIVSKVVAQDEIAVQDNGLAQSVAVKKGISGAMTESVVTNGTYTLRPYRTFREIDQPESRFILRLKPAEGGLPQVALFDAEGGLWRHAAMQAVATWIRATWAEGAKVPVIA